MTRWATANPFATCFLVIVALLALCWFVSWLWGSVEVECCDASECERPAVGDLVVSIYEHRRVPVLDAGDGEEAGV